MDVQKIHELIENGLTDGAYSCYAVAVGRGREVLFKSVGGCRAIEPTRLPMTEDTLFDMASLSKLMGTTMAVLKLVEQNKLSFTNKLGDYFDNCYGKENITIFDLMTHTSGIKAHFPLWLRGITPDMAAETVLREDLRYQTSSDVVYSCMGYILLAKILEKIEQEPLDKIVNRLVFAPLGMNNTCYCPKNKPCAATERDADTGEIICGVVHDENARFLNGISGNAGVFSDLDDCIKFATMVAEKGKGFIDERLFDYAVTDFTPTLSERRGIGFQHVYNRYGHTGFTGTSIYNDKNSDLYAILLTNRVHPTRNNDKLMKIRPELHKLVFGE
ncbi:MAG: beta-lactamase family protein [Clostridia bacterium]|nr:beta-lactamase family protein [Clostridia bacterium]